jgi:E3 ubiquitin-protein ligase SHPRH
LQEVSDAVAPYKEELDVELDRSALDKTKQKEQASSAKIRTMKATNTYLTVIREDETAGKKPQRICVICLCPFDRGVITVCGHMSCKECLQEWMKGDDHKHRSCPQCRQKIGRADLHDIHFKAQELKGQEEMRSGTASPSELSSSPSRESSIYSDVDAQLLQEIKAIELPTSYGTKIDTLGKHLHWIREHDPGAKSIVFSQYKEFLDVLAIALKHFKVGYARLGKGGSIEKFKQDPSIDCLLLDAKTDSSGITLVNATHVFISEPLIQTAVELQAIARVHRIGQTRPTTVWMYIISDTVEEAIYDISVTRRLEHVRERQSIKAQKSRSTTPAPLQENAIEAANSAELQSAPLTKLLTSGKSGGEVVRNDDLWQCLFGKKQNAPLASSRADDKIPEVSRFWRADAAERRAQEAMESDY